MFATICSRVCDGGGRLRGAKMPEASGTKRCRMRILDYFIMFLGGLIFRAFCAGPGNN